MSEEVKPHETKLVVIKEARVDLLMVPLVKWMNSFRSVTTLYCCQGEPTPYDLDEDVEEGEEYAPQLFYNRPYILWTCTDSVDLIQILKVFGGGASTEVDWFSPGASLRYCTRFYSQGIVKELSDLYGEEEEDDFGL